MPALMHKESSGVGASQGPGRGACAWYVCHGERLLLTRRHGVACAARAAPLLTHRTLRRQVCEQLRRLTTDLEAAAQPCLKTTTAGKARCHAPVTCTAGVVCCDLVWSRSAAWWRAPGPS